MSREKKSLLSLSEKEKNQNKIRYDDKNKQNSKNSIGGNIYGVWKQTNWIVINTSDFFVDENIFIYRNYQVKLLQNLAQFFSLVTEFCMHFFQLQLILRSVKVHWQWAN